MPKKIIFLTLDRRSLLLLCGAILVILSLWGITTETPVSVPPDNCLAGYSIAIDPGHGGRDAGSMYQKISEKDVTLMLSQAIAAEIQRHGGKAILTRTTDTDLWDSLTYQEEIAITKQEYAEDIKQGKSINRRDEGIALGTRYPPTYRLGLRSRLLIAEDGGADLLISVHTNHYRAASAKGAVTLYQPDSEPSRQLAISLQKHLQELLPGRASPGIMEDDFFVLRRSKIPTVLIEVGFLSNQRDRQFMLSESGQLSAAQAVVAGICDFLQNQPATPR